MQEDVVEIFILDVRAWGYCTMVQIAKQARGSKERLGPCGQLRACR